MHGELRIGDAGIMFAGAGGMWKEKTGGNVPARAFDDSLFESAVANGARSLGKPARKDHGYTAGFEDPFGNQWFIVQA